ncbi:MAG: hypothetical protein GY946_01940 [bacterium]|nr:hypothetical protein [bacterium]
MSRRDSVRAGPAGTALALLCSLAPVSCDDVVEIDIPHPDFAMFETEVYPILARDCAFTMCHGDPARYFQLYAPGRLRLDPEIDLLDPATPEELAISYDHTRAMMLGDGPVRDTPLLRKPREGAGHAGVDANGRNVYTGRDDPSYARLEAWAQEGMR